MMIVVFDHIADLHVSVGDRRRLVAIIGRGRFTGKGRIRRIGIKNGDIVRTGDHWWRYISIL